MTDAKSMREVLELRRSRFVNGATQSVDEASPSARPVDPAKEPTRERRPRARQTAESNDLRPVSSEAIRTKPRVREQLELAATFSQKAGVSYIRRFNLMCEQRRFVKRDSLEGAFDYLFQKYDVPELD